MTTITTKTWKLRLEPGIGREERDKDRKKW